MNSLFGYKITDKTLVHIAQIERDIALIRNTELKASSRVRSQEEAIFDDLFAISRLLNLNLSLTDIKKIALGTDISGDDEKLLINLRQVFDFLKNNYRSGGITFNFYLLQHIVKLIQNDLIEVWEVGRIRSGGDEFNRKFELINQKYPENPDISRELAEAVLWVENDEFVHPIIKAIVFFIYINLNSPFTAMNFAISLICFRVILDKFNYGNEYTISLLKIFSQDLSLKDFVENEVNNFTQESLTKMIEVFAEKLGVVISTYKKEFIEIDYYDVKSSVGQIELNERQVKLLKLLQEKVSIRRNEYAKLFKISPMTSYRDLNALNQSKLLISKGIGKATKYYLATKA